VLVSPVVTATVWEFLLSPVGGFFDTVLGWFGLAQTNWLQQPDTAKYAIVAISGWKVLGVSVLIVTAGLAAISTEYYEAAAIDGAGRFQVFRRVTLPLLSPTLLFMFIFVVLLSSQIIFPLVNALTQGGPAGTTTDIYYFLYTNGFMSFDVGLASAAAVCFFVVFGAVALVCIRLLDRFSFYDN
jgi:multiple sugar transport system permease protein